MATVTPQELQALAAQPKPFVNHPATIWGTTIAIQLIALIAVALRMYARIRVVHSPGWDDAFVCMAVTFATLGTIFVCLCAYYGLGTHLLLLSAEQFHGYLRSYYIANATYVTSTCLIKLSLLFQYLRIYKEGWPRKATIALATFVAIWGIVFGFMAWFPCFPPQVYWHWAGGTPNPSCYGYGDARRTPFVSMYEGHTVLNMLLDTSVLLMLSPMWVRRGLTRREWYSVFGILFFGSLIIVLALWRLVEIIEHAAGFEPTEDFTWWCPLMIILSCFEVDVAILTASTPVFWPIVESSLMAITVTMKIQVTSRRAGDSDVEMEDRSLHSTTDSEAGLKGAQSHSSATQQLEDYKKERAVPFAYNASARGRTSIDGTRALEKSGPKNSWMEID